MLLNWTPQKSGALWAERGRFRVGVYPRELGVHIWTPDGSYAAPILVTREASKEEWIEKAKAHCEEKAQEYLDGLRAEAAAWGYDLVPKSEVPDATE